ncbi:unnamed protein product [Didymodactylos carnosus]|uniref:FAD dependent oxidoreductase domain-containing protein n=1 Tax=Didymodactylos carnosus TaxID=1234261 RepID=A0A814KVF5_9BILA|nr:unnamed protein product [Didymodactylos carnosus]CAF1056464.1 unnamed protein product [Didymodactylos carnosus]CAF3772789.1 unnamed protein product [Didymodactylos carnosus]CAF3825463.1 unnamed protein product [Didymodactylos carnosus]
MGSSATLDIIRTGTDLTRINTEKVVELGIHLSDVLKLISEVTLRKGCEEGMDQAALTILAVIVLRQTFCRPSDFEIARVLTNESITVIGAGIAGLVAALFLSVAGYRVTVIDRHDKPMLGKDLDVYNGGTTMGGCDARHASVTEAVAAPTRIRSLRLMPMKKGWKMLDKMSVDEQMWAKKFEAMSAFPAMYSIFSDLVTSVNRVAIDLWEDLFERIPELAENAIRSRRIVRLCTSELAVSNTLKFQRKVHRKNDEVVRLSEEQMVARFPHLNRSHLAGGIEVEGFTINVKQLGDNLINYLEKKQQVTFRWASEVASLQDTAVTLYTGEKIISDRILLATGVSGDDLLKGSPITKQVQGVIGYWLTLPNINMITEGFKIHEEDPVAVMNVTMSVDNKTLIISGGFGFVGNQRIMKTSRYTEMAVLVALAVKKYFPTEFEKATESNKKLRVTYCVRPMSADGMPLIDWTTANSAKTMYVGGTSGGGFVQASILSLFVLDMVSGRNTYSHITQAMASTRDSLSNRLYYSVDRNACAEETIENSMISLDPAIQQFAEDFLLL